MPVEWDNAVKRTGSCSQCQKGFQELELYNATLVEAEDGFQRRDFCQACWSESFRDQAFSYWQAKVPKKEEKKKLFVDDTVLMDFFRRLTENPDESKNGFCFVLALILLRKRLLKYVSTEPQKDGSEVWLMKISGDDKDYKVPNPHLDDQQIEQIRSELTSVLSGD